MGPFGSLETSVSNDRKPCNNSEDGRITEGVMFVQNVGSH
jgi:hypothetical protein